MGSYAFMIGTLLAAFVAAVFFRIVVVRHLYLRSLQRGMWVSVRGERSINKGQRLWIVQVNPTTVILSSDGTGTDGVIVPKSSVYPYEGRRVHRVVKA